MAGFQSQIEELVYSYLKIDRPKRKIVKEEVIKEELDPASLLPKDLEAVSSPESEKPKSPLGSQDDLDKQTEENDDDFESPAFELLEGVVVETVTKKEDDSHLSGLSNMTSEGSVTNENKQKEMQTSQQLTFESMESVKQEEDESQLSQVSSGSRLSIVVQSEKDSLSPKPEVLNITEEAQMPKFSENSNSIDAKGSVKENFEGPSLFDFKKEEIEFKGPCRTQMTLDEKLKEEIYESENKHANIFKTDDTETNSHSSDLKLEIVEQNITESESGMKIDIEMSETTDKIDENLSQKPDALENVVKSDEKVEKSSPSDSSKKERSHHKTSKSSKHKDKDRDRKHSSTHSTSKSRHSDRDRHHSSSKHKSSSSSSRNRDRERHSKSSSSRDRHHRSRSDHKSSGKDHHSSREKVIERTPDEKRCEEVKSQNSEEKTPKEILSQNLEEEEKMTENVNQPPSTSFSEQNSMEIEDPRELTPVKMSKERDSQESVLCSDPVTPKPQIASDSLENSQKNSSGFMSDEDDFYGFSESETPQIEFTTPKKAPSDSKNVNVTPGPSSSQKSVMNQSINDEESFYGFDDGTPIKSQSSDTKTVVVTEKPEEKSGNGKRVRKPNTKYLSEDFTTTHDDDEEEEKDKEDEIPKSSSKKRKRPDSGTKQMKKQKSEDKAENEKEKLPETPEMPELTAQGTSDSVSSKSISPKVPMEKHGSSEKSSKSSKKHSKYDSRSSGSRSSSRHK